MKHMDPTLRNASAVLAGGVCVALVLGRLFSPFNGLVPVRGFWFTTLLAVPLLCLWCGMLVHYRSGRFKPWLLVLVGILAAVELFLTLRSLDSPGFYGESFRLTFCFFLGILIPWDHIRENGDKVGAKSIVLGIITALSYSALFLVWQRLGNVMKPENADMEQLLHVVTTHVLPLASIPPLIFATEFSFSQAGQWLGSRKWFFWLALPAAVYCFLTTLAILPEYWWYSFSWGFSRLIRFFVQPVTVYLMIVIWRIFRSLCKSKIEWKEVFKI